MKNEIDLLTDSSETLLDSSELLKRLYILLSSNGQIFFTNKKLIYLSRSLAGMIGGLAGVPYLRIVREHAGKNTFLKYLYQYSIVTSVGTLTIWSLLDFIEYYDHTIKDTKEGKCCKLSYNASSMLLGSISSIVGIYISYKYNDNNNILYATLAAFADTTNNSCAFNRSFREFYLIYKKPKSSIIQLQIIVHDRLQDGLKVLINKNDEINEFLLNYKLTESDVGITIDESKEIFLHLLKLGSKNYLKFNDSKLYRYTDYFLLAVSRILPLGWAVLSFKLIFDALKSKNLFLGMSFAFFATLPNYLLETILARMLFSNIHQMIIKVFNGQQYKTAAMKFHMTPYLALCLLGLFSTTLSFSGRAEVVDDNSSGILHDLTFYTAIISTIIYKSSAMINLVSKTIAFMSRKFDKQNAALFNFTTAIEKYLITLKHSPSHEFIQFLDDINIGMLVEDIELDQELRTAMSKYSQQYNQSLNNSSFFNEGDNPMNETKQPFAIKSRCNII